MNQPFQHRMKGRLQYRSRAEFKQSSSSFSDIHSRWAFIYTPQCLVALPCRVGFNIEPPLQMHAPLASSVMCAGCLCSHHTTHHQWATGNGLRAMTHDGASFPGFGVFRSVRRPRLDSGHWSSEHCKSQGLNPGSCGLPFGTRRRHFGSGRVIRRGKSGGASGKEGKTADDLTDFPAPEGRHPSGVPVGVGGAGGRCACKEAGTAATVRRAPADPGTMASRSDVKDVDVAAPRLHRGVNPRAVPPTPPSARLQVATPDAPRRGELLARLATIIRQSY